MSYKLKHKTYNQSCRILQETDTASFDAAKILNYYLRGLRKLVLFAMT